MKYYKISTYTLYAISVAIIAVCLAFFFGGDAEGAAVLAGVDPEMWQPAQTDLLLYLMYGLFALAVVITLVVFVAQFIAALRDNPVKALKSLAGGFLLVIVLFVSWGLGSEEKLNIPGYDGTENVPFWLKLTDMFLYSIYILFGGALVAMLFGWIKKRFA